MKNLDLVNRDRLDEMLILLARECHDICHYNNIQTCHDCPYKEACDAIEQIEFALMDKGTD